MSGMDEIELKMAKILDVLRIPYESQKPIGVQMFDQKCKSHFHCHFKGDNWFMDGFPRCHRDDDGECEWMLPSFGYPRYVIDFAVQFNGRMVDIEVDGKYHLYPGQASKDRERTNYLEKRGWMIKRFTATRIYNHPGAIKKEILSFKSSLLPKTLSLFEEKATVKRGADDQ